MLVLRNLLAKLGYLNLHSHAPKFLMNVCFLAATEQTAKLLRAGTDINLSLQICRVAGHCEFQEFNLVQSTNRCSLVILPAILQRPESKQAACRHSCLYRQCKVTGITNACELILAPVNTADIEKLVGAGPPASNDKIKPVGNGADDKDVNNNDE